MAQVSITFLLLYWSIVIWTTFSCDSLFDNQIIQKNLGSGTKIKAIERESRRTLSVREKAVTKVVKKCRSNIISHCTRGNFYLKMLFSLVSNIKKKY